jgi:agmatinase
VSAGSSDQVLGPADALTIPRFAGVRTFGRLPLLETVERADVAVLGAPFDGGVSFRPGARFGPAAVRDASILLRPYHEPLGVDVFTGVQCADAGDAPAPPTDIRAAHAAITARALEVMDAGGGAPTRVVGIGGDHSCALAFMRAAAERHGPLSLIQLDAHSDTWDAYFGEKVTHGTIMRRAVEEGVVDARTSSQIGMRGPLYEAADLQDARELGFSVVTTAEAVEHGPLRVVEDAVARAGAHVYVSFDVDVLDPAHAPGTGTPEPGGLSTREAQAMLRALAPAAERMVAADVVEVSPPYDHAGITASVGANMAFELMALMALGVRGRG